MAFEMQDHKDLSLSKFIYTADILAEIVFKAIFVFKGVIYPGLFGIGDNRIYIIFQDFIGYLYIFGRRCESFCKFVWRRPCKPIFAKNYTSVGFAFAHKPDGATKGFVALNFANVIMSGATWKAK